MRALRPVRGALSDGSVGHAPFRAALALCRQVSGPTRTRSELMQNDRTNDFALRIATVNGTGSASANGLLMQSIFRMGIPVSGKNVFPSNIQGLPTWYEIRVNHRGYTARAPHFDLIVALNPSTYQRDVAEVRPGGYLLYDSSWPLDTALRREDVSLLGIPLG